MRNRRRSPSMSPHKNSLTAKTKWHSRLSLRWIKMLTQVAATVYVLVVGAIAIQHPKSYHKESAAKYDFSYRVKDEKNKNDFGHQESRIGSKTTGQYKVLLPDGRTQVVTYTADETGYHPVITYEGEKTTDSPRGYKSSPPSPSYKPTTYPHHPAPPPYQHHLTAFKPLFTKPEETTVPYKLMHLLEGHTSITPTPKISKVDTKDPDRKHQKPYPTPYRPLHPAHSHNHESNLPRPIPPPYHPHHYLDLHHPPHLHHDHPQHLPPHYPPPHHPRHPPHPLNPQSKGPYPYLVPHSSPHYPHHNLYPYPNPHNDHIHSHIHRDPYHPTPYEGHHPPPPHKGYPPHPPHKGYPPNPPPKGYPPPPPHKGYPPPPYKGPVHTPPYKGHSLPPPYKAPIHSPTHKAPIYPPIHKGPVDPPTHKAPIHPATHKTTIHPNKQAAVTRKKLLSPLKEPAHQPTLPRPTHPSTSTASARSPTQKGSLLKPKENQSDRHKPSKKPHRTYKGVYYPQPTYAPLPHPTKPPIRTQITR